MTVASFLGAPVGLGWLVSSLLPSSKLEEQAAEKVQEKATTVIHRFL